MAISSGIEWTEATWNPVTGCTKLSAGCVNCYAEKMAMRLKATGSRKYKNGFDLTTHPDSLGEPLSWKKPKMIFVCSMGDLFHLLVPTIFILDVLMTMRRSPHHTFQVLTKRSGRLWELNDVIDWPGNMWAGVTVESAENLWRVDDLRKTDCKIKFISMEPLLSEIKSINLNGIDWVIAGGESGPGARPMKNHHSILHWHLPWSSPPNCCSTSRCDLCPSFRLSR